MWMQLFLLTAWSRKLGPGTKHARSVFVRPTKPSSMTLESPRRGPPTEPDEVQHVGWGLVLLLLFVVCVPIIMLLIIVLNPDLLNIPILPELPKN